MLSVEDIEAKRFCWKYQVMTFGLGIGQAVKRKTITWAKECISNLNLFHLTSRPSKCLWTMWKKCLSPRAKLEPWLLRARGAPRALPMSSLLPFSASSLHVGRSGCLQVLAEREQNRTSSGRATGCSENPHLKTADWPRRLSVCYR